MREKTKQEIMQLIKNHASESKLNDYVTIGHALRLLFDYFKLDVGIIELKTKK